MISSKDADLAGMANRADPLGVLAVWSARAREIVPHLTEQTTDVRGFQILADAFRLWRIFNDTEPQDTGRLPDFLMLVEQAFARTIGHRTHDWPLPGRRRVRGRLGDPPCISLKDNGWHLLSGQLANGIWGLYRGAARRAGLLDETMLNLSATTEQAADATSCLQDKAIEQLFQLVRPALLGGDTVVLPTHGNKALYRDLCRTFTDVPLKRHLQARLVDDHGLNRAVAERLVVVATFDHRDFMEKTANELDEPALRRVIQCENLLAVVEGVFYRLCCAKGKRLDDAANALPVDLQAVEGARQAFAQSGEYPGQTAAARQTRFYERLDTSSRTKLAHSVLSLHETVSQERERTPWIWEEQGKLQGDADVTEPGEGALAVGLAWRNDYYLRPLREIAGQLKRLGT